MKLIRVKRGRGVQMFVEGMRRELYALPQAREFHQEYGDATTDCDFFLVDDREVDQAMKALGTRNLGMDIEVYNLEKVGHCPAADFVIKVVNEDGVLPA